jgi:hypothetical protein
MAKTVSLSDPNLIGKMVYQSYSPQKAGKIIGRAGYQDHVVEMHGQTYTTKPFMVIVKWLKGASKMVPLHNLRDLEALIVETEKKLATHLATRTMVRGL